MIYMSVQTASLPRKNNKIKLTEKSLILIGYFIYYSRLN